MFNNIYYKCICILYGAAWLSSVRVVKCGVESPNERNPSYLNLKF